MLAVERTNGEYQFRAVDEDTKPGFLLNNRQTTAQGRCSIIDLQNPYFQAGRVILPQCFIFIEAIDSDNGIYK